MSQTAAELIAKIAVDGEKDFSAAMNRSGKAVDTLAKKCEEAGKLMNGSLKKGLRSAGQSAMEAVSPMNLLHGGWNLLMGAFRAGLSLIESVGKGLFALGAAATYGFVALTKSAVEEASKIETLTGKYYALTGSMKAAVEQMTFMKQFAKTSLLQFDTLADVGTTLASRGLDPRRWMSSVSNIGGVFGKEKAAEYAEAIARIKSGAETGRAIMDLGTMGIDRQSLSGKGVQFAKSGELISSTTQALAAIEAVTRDKFSKIAQAMKDTLSIRISNLTDAWNQMLESWGKSFFPFIKKAIDTVQPFIAFLTDSGTAGNIASNFAAGMEKVFGAMKGGGFAQFAATLVATFEQIPSLLESAGKFLVEMAHKASDAFILAFNAIGNGITNLINVLIPVLKPLVHILGGIALAGYNLTHPFDIQSGAGYNRYREFSRSVGGIVGGVDKMQPMGAWKNMQAGDFKASWDKLMDKTGIAPTLSKIGTRRDELVKQFAEYQKKTQSTPDGSKFSMFLDGQGPANNYLNAIANNTKETATAVNMNLQKSAIGGGDLGFGVTAVEVAGARNAAATIDFGPHKRGLDGVFQTMLQEGISQLIRQGVLKVAGTR